MLTYHELELVTGTAGAPPPPPPPGIRKNLSIFARHQPEPFVITTISSAAIVLTIFAGHCAARGALILLFQIFYIAMAAGQWLHHSKMQFTDAFNVTSSIFSLSEY